MYELWSIWPANLGAVFSSAREAELQIRAAVERGGPEMLDNLALFMYFNDEDEMGSCIAENQEILGEVTRRRIVEELHEALKTASETLDVESTAIFEKYISSFTDIESASGFASDVWMKGFLAAALHSVSIDIDEGVIHIGKDLASANSSTSTLKPTG